MNEKRIYGVVGVVAVAALGVGVAAGFVFGLQRGRVDGDRDVKVAREQGVQERNAQADADAKRIRDLVAQFDAAKVNAKPEPVAIEPEQDRGIDNDKFVEFFDDPKKHEGKELTVLLRYRTVPGQAGDNLRDHLKWRNANDTSGQKGASADFYGASSTGAAIKVNLGIPNTVEVPAARDGDPLVITLKCVVIRVKGYTEPTGVCSKIVRPR